MTTKQEMIEALERTISILHTHGYVDTPSDLLPLLVALKKAQRAYSDTKNKQVIFSNGQPLHGYWQPVLIIPWEDESL